MSKCNCICPPGVCMRDKYKELSTRLEAAKRVIYTSGYKKPDQTIDEIIEYMENKQ